MTLKLFIHVPRHHKRKVVRNPWLPWGSPCVSRGGGKKKKIHFRALILETLQPEERNGQVLNKWPLTTPTPIRDKLNAEKAPT